MLPLDGTGLQIDAIEPVVQRDFISQLDIALDQLGFRLFFREAFALQLGVIVIAVGGADLRRLGLALGHGGRDEYLAARDDR